MTIFSSPPSIVDRDEEERDQQWPFASPPVAQQPPLIEDDVVEDAPEPRKGPALGSKRLTFPESVAIERTDEPLVDASASSRLRRHLFRGETLSAEDAVRLVGGSNGLLGAASRLMEEWGFNFVKGVDEAGHTTLKLANPQHVPTTHVKKAGSGITRQRLTAPSTNSKTAKVRGTRSPVHDEIAERLKSGEPVSVYETTQAGASDAFLRREVKRLEGEGYKFSVEGHAQYRTYTMTKAPKGKAVAKASGESSAAVAKPTKKSASHDAANASAIDMLFPNMATPAPKLGGAVRVIGALLDEENDDELVLVMRNGTGTWRARVEGYAEPDES